MSASSFKPSEVALVGVPLVATMGRTETEAAAAIIVRTCAVMGDTWRSVSVAEITAVLRAEGANEHAPLHALLLNPFWRPDAQGLVDAGFAQWEGEPRKSPIALTEAGIERLRCWVVRRDDATIEGEVRP